MKQILIIEKQTKKQQQKQQKQQHKQKQNLVSKMNRRALHYVLKIGDRKKNVEFFRDLLGMKVLRHEEFHEMCQAQCNGPYDGRWSKTMIGYGPENENFVLELTYNYGIGNYKLGNDLVSIQIQSKSIYEKILKKNNNNNDNNIVFMHKNPETIVLNSPDGYLFEIYNNPDNNEKNIDIIKKVALSSENLNKSKNYWNQLLEMKLIKEENDDKSFLVSYENPNYDFHLEFISTTNGQPVRHEKAYGRIAFSCPESDLSKIQDLMLEKKQTILTKLVSLDTPGKATVQVVILADPDKHEICFVGETGFNELSKVDPEADKLLNEAIEKDKSDDWFKKRGIEKEKAE